jgi:pyruvate kinase
MYSGEGEVPMRKTKIVCTVGPASKDSAIVRKLVQKVDVFRINFSHGTIAGHQRDIRTIRNEALRAGKIVGILQDLPGPKTRVGRIQGGSVELVRGSEVLLTGEPVEGDARRISVNNPALLESVRVGDLIYLADGLISLKVTHTLQENARCTVLVGGVLGSGKGVNAPGVKFKVQFPTPKDLQLLALGLREGVDFVALSFVRSPADVKALRRHLTGRIPMLIVKVEKREAVKNFDQLLDEADGVMVARGDLGIEVPIETVPTIQKHIIRKCNTAGKPVIVATQMLVSMVNSPVPTRAEVTDVSNAILDGADAVMLSDETTVGKYPVEAVNMLERIALSTEKSLSTYSQPLVEGRASDTGEAIGRAACRLADYVHAKAIVAPTQSGSTARRVAMYRPAQPIVALCTEPRVARRLKLVRGVHPVMTKQAKTMDWLFERADLAAEEMGLARRGERIVVTSGTPGMMGTTNLIKVSVVGSRPE